MVKSDKKTSVRYIISLLLVFFALLCRILARSVFDPAFSLLLNFTRSFIHFGIFFLWGFSVRQRVVSVRTKNLLAAVSAMILFWTVLKEIKYRFAVDPTVLRYLWYIYYVPLLFVPLFALFISMIPHRREEKAAILTAALCSVTLIIAALIMTNDLHMLAFRFPQGKPMSESDYKYGPLYYIAAGWAVLCSLSALFTMEVRSVLPDRKKLIWQPLIPFMISVVYTVLYAARISLIKDILGDITVFFCLVFVAFFEICIRCGLIQSNTRYLDLFEACEGLDIQITDGEYNVKYKSEDAAPIPKEIMMKAAEEPVFSGGKRIHGINIGGGHAVWAEDLSKLLSLRSELCDRIEELTERNALLQYEYEKEKEHKTVEEQNRLYDLIESRTGAQLKQIDDLISVYERSEDEQEKKRLLSKTVVLGSYIKRRKDLVLSAEASELIPVSKLTLAFAESFHALHLHGVRGGASVMLDRETENGAVISEAYDFFEAVTEEVIDTARYINVRVSGQNGFVRVNVSTDAEAFLSGAPARFPSMRTVCDDGFEYISDIAVKGGVS